MLSLLIGNSNFYFPAQNTTQASCTKVLLFLFMLTKITKNCLGAIHRSAVWLHYIRIKFCILYSYYYALLCRRLKTAPLWKPMVQPHFTFSLILLLNRVRGAVRSGGGLSRETRESPDVKRFRIQIGKCSQSAPILVQLIDAHAALQEAARR